MVRNMTVVLSNTCLACKQPADVFNALTVDEVEKIDCNKSSVDYKPGEIIFKQGAPANSFVCVTSGLVKLYKEHHPGSNLVIGLTKPVNYIFEPGPFVNHHHHITAVACEYTTACLIDAHVVKDLISTNPHFASEIIKKISFLTVSLFNRISSCTQKHVYGRVADTLLYLYPGIYPNNPFEIALSRQDLADMSGMTKESIIRVLKKFKEDNIIQLEGNTMQIIDREKLEFISVKG